MGVLHNLRQSQEYSRRERREVYKPISAIIIDGIKKIWEARYEVVAIVASFAIIYFLPTVWFWVLVVIGGIIGIILGFLRYRRGLFIALLMVAALIVVEYMNSFKG